MIVPRPVHREEEPVVKDEELDNTLMTPEFQAFWNVPDWKCIECGAVMFGRVLECVYCRVRLNTRTPRPSTYTIHHL